MESLSLLIPLSVALVLLTGWVFWRALQSGQFDDLERPGHALLDDDDSALGRDARRFENCQRPPRTDP